MNNNNFQLPLSAPLIFLGTVVAVLFASAFYLYWFSLPLGPHSSESKIFVVQKGEGFKEISINLEKEGLIKSSLFFRVLTFFSGGAGKLKAGIYELSPLMTPYEISDKLVSGDVIKEKITIIEGWNLRDIGWYFEGIFALFQAEELFELVGFPLIDYSKASDLPEPKDFSQDLDFLKDKPKNVSLEGYLFPDTYEISKGDSVEEIVKKMLNNFDKKLTPDLKEEIKNQGKSIFEIITMASLIEKEVRTLEDKKMVSGILWKRLKNGMPLQIDATITYITGKKTTKVSIEETKIDSPYNTYKYLGLPLGPISNPGLESIIAVLYPQGSQYWYYLSTPEGETIFSKTLKEHNLAKTKYLR